MTVGWGIRVGVFTVLGALYSAELFAADFKLIPRARVAVSATDNVDLTPDDRLSDLVFLLEPGLTISANGRKLKGSVDYFVEHLRFVRDGGDDTRHNLSGVIDAEVIDDLLFLSGRASLRQVFLNRQNSLSGSSFNRTENRRLVQTYTGEARLARRLSGDIEFGASYRFGVSLSAADNLNDPSLTVNFSDTTSHEYAASINSGNERDRLSWRILVNGSRVTRSLNDRNFENDRAEAELRYRFSSTYELFGRAGWINNNFVSPLLGSAGFSWSAGLRFTPSGRTTVEVRAGEDGRRKIFAGRLDHKLTRRVNVAVNYSDELSSNVLVENALLAGTPALVGDLAPDRDPFSAQINSPNFTLSDLDFRRRSLNTSLTWRRRRTSAQISGNLERRTFDSSEGTAKLLGGSLRLTHELSKQSSLQLQTRFTRNEFENSLRNDNTILNRLEYRKTFLKNVEGVISYSYSERFSNVAGGDLREHGLIFSLQAIF